MNIRNRLKKTFKPLNIFVVGVALASIAFFLIIACPRETVIVQYYLLGGLAFCLISIAAVIYLIRDWKRYREKRSKDGNQ